MKHFGFATTGHDVPDTFPTITAKAKLISAAVALFFMGNVSAQYKSESIFSSDYKCVSEEKGGFNHDASGHKLTLFKGVEEFFLTHISNIPEQAILHFAGRVRGGKNMTVGELREELELRIFEKQKTYGDDYVVEVGSYYIRKPEEDPKKIFAYSAGKSCKAGALRDMKEHTISCYLIDSRKTFNFDVNTGRFTYSYAGTWDQPVKDGYHGDSAVFAFGTCKVYFR